MEKSQSQLQTNPTPTSVTVYEYNDEHLTVYSQPLDITIYDEHELDDMLCDTATETEEFDFNDTTLFNETQLNIVERYKNLYKIADTDLGCDNDDCGFWIDKRTGKISATDGRDDTNISFDVCNTVDELIEVWHKYVALCKTDTNFQLYCSGFGDMMTWNECMAGDCSNEERERLTELWKSNHNPTTKSYCPFYIGDVVYIGQEHLFS